MAEPELLNMPPAFTAPASTGTLTVQNGDRDTVDLDVSVLRLQPGDVVVLRYDGHITVQASEQIRAYFDAEFGDRGIKAIVLDGSLSVDGVLRMPGERQ